MTEKEKHWYQDGWTILAIVAVLVVASIWINRAWRQNEAEQKPLGIVASAGRLEDADTDQPILHLKFWHFHPGSLRNGRLIVTVAFPGIPKVDRVRIFAFDAWEPNDEHAVIWKVPLPGYELDEQVPVHVQLQAENARQFAYTQIWLGTDWIEDEFSTSE